MINAKPGAKKQGPVQVVTEGMWMWTAHALSLQAFQYIINRINQNISKNTNAEGVGIITMNTKISSVKKNAIRISINIQSVRTKNVKKKMLGEETSLRIREEI